jgi:hypothetical protein
VRCDCLESYYIYDMKIHFIGDSHSNSFKGLGKIHYLGPVTLQRMGYVEDSVISNKITKIRLKPRDILFFCFGEIDVRCYVKPNLKRKEIDVLISNWVDRYTKRISALMLKSRIGIVSVTPPTVIDIADTKEYPVAGTDSERVIYTKCINKYLKESCENNGWTYLDTFSKYEKDGMLQSEDSDGTVHIKDKMGLKKLLEQTIDKVVWYKKLPVIDLFINKYKTALPKQSTERTDGI